MDDSNAAAQDVEYLTLKKFGWSSDSANKTIKMNRSRALNRDDQSLNITHDQDELFADFSNANTSSRRNSENKLLSNAQFEEYENQIAKNIRSIRRTSINSVSSSQNRRNSNEWLERKNSTETTRSGKNSSPLTLKRQENNDDEEFIVSFNTLEYKDNAKQADEMFENYEINSNKGFGRKMSQNSDQSNSEKRKSNKNEESSSKSKHIFCFLIFYNNYFFFFFVI
jgi:hypothetical protein